MPPQLNGRVPLELWEEMYNAYQNRVWDEVDSNSTPYQEAPICLGALFRQLESLVSYSV